jgi:hypothetical protein
MREALQAWAIRRFVRALVASIDQAHPTVGALYFVSVNGCSHGKVFLGR